MTDGQPLGERVARLEALMEAMSNDIREIREDVKEMRKKLDGRLAEVENRVSALERWRAWVLGAAAVIGAAADALWRWWSAQNR